MSLPSDQLPSMEELREDGRSFHSSFLVKVVLAICLTALVFIEPWSESLLFSNENFAEQLRVLARILATFSLLTVLAVTLLSLFQSRFLIRSPLGKVKHSYQPVSRVQPALLQALLRLIAFLLLLSGSVILLWTAPFVLLPGFEDPPHLLERFLEFSELIVWGFLALGFVAGLGLYALQRKRFAHGFRLKSRS